MRDERVVPFDGGTARVLKLADAQELEAWQRAFQGKPKSRRYYELIEQTLANDFEFRYLVLEDGAGNVRAVQSVFFVRQNLIEGVRGTFRKIVDLIRKKFPRFFRNARLRKPQKSGTKASKNGERGKDRDGSHQRSCTGYRRDFCSLSPSPLTLSNEI